MECNTLAPFPFTTVQGKKVREKNIKLSSSTRVASFLNFLIRCNFHSVTSVSNNTSFLVNYICPLKLGKGRRVYIDSNVDSGDDKFSDGELHKKFSLYVRHRAYYESRTEERQTIISSTYANRILN